MYDILSIEKQHRGSLLQMLQNDAMCIHIYVHTYVCMYVCLFVCLFVWVFVCQGIHVCVQYLCNQTKPNPKAVFFAFKYRIVLMQIYINVYNIQNILTCNLGLISNEPAVLFIHEIYWQFLIFFIWTNQQIKTQSYVSNYLLMYVYI